MNLPIWITCLKAEHSTTTLPNQASSKLIATISDKPLKIINPILIDYTTYFFFSFTFFLASSARGKIIDVRLQILQQRDLKTMTLYSCVLYLMQTKRSFRSLTHLVLVWKEEIQSFLLHSQSWCYWRPTEFLLRGQPSWSFCTGMWGAQL